MKWMVCLFLLAAPIFATAANAEPKAVVQDIFKKAGAPEIATEAGKQQEVSTLVDFEALAKAALGKELKKTKPEDFQWFRSTLEEIITRTVYPKAPEFLKDVKIVYNSVETKGEKSTVKSTVQNKADLTDVDYQLALTKGADWKVVDVSIAGQSWVESIRDQVSQVIKKKKWKGLKDSMNRRLNELRAGSKSGDLLRMAPRPESLRCFSSAYVEYAVVVAPRSPGLGAILATIPLLEPALIFGKA